MSNPHILDYVLKTEYGFDPLICCIDLCFGGAAGGERLAFRDLIDGTIVEQNKSRHGTCGEWKEFLQRSRVRDTLILGTSIFI